MQPIKNKIGISDIESATSQYVIESNTMIFYDDSIHKAISSINV